MPMNIPEPEVQQPHLQVIGGFLTENSRKLTNGVVNVARGGKEWVDGLSPGTKAVTVGVAATAATFTAAPAVLGYVASVTAAGPTAGGLCAWLQAAGYSTAAIQSTVMTGSVSTTALAVPGMLTSGLTFRRAEKNAENERRHEQQLREEKTLVRSFATCMVGSVVDIAIRNAMNRPPPPPAAFEPDLSNTEEREAGVSKKMSTEAQEDCDSYRFLDLSNIQICAQINGDDTKDRSVRLKYDSLDELVMMARRAPVRNFCYGSRSHNDTSDSVVDKYYNKSTGWDVCMFTRAPGVGEEIVDTALVAQIQETLLNVGAPQRIILMTGDGNPNGGRGVSFFNAVMTALDRGWIVEIWSWKASCNKLYKNLVGTSRFSLHYLDDFRDKITLSDVDCKPKAKPRTKLMSIDKGKGVSRADMLNPNNPNYNPALASQRSKKPHIPRKTSAINCSVPEWD